MTDLDYIFLHIYAALDELEFEVQRLLANSERLSDRLKTYAVTDDPENVTANEQAIDHDAPSK